MQFLSLGIDCGHGARELFVDTIVDRDRAVIGILTVEAALGRLVGVLAHQADECIRVEHLLRNVRIYALALLLLAVQIPD